MAGGTQLTLIGQSLVLRSANIGGVTESSSTSNQYTSVSSVKIGNYTAIVDRDNRFDLCSVELKQSHDIMDIGGMHFVL
jgi:hypothetical protein